MSQNINSMKFSIVLLLVVHASGIAQSVATELKPSETRLLDLSAEGEAKFNDNLERYAKISEKLSSGTKMEDLTPEERRILNETNETMEDYWDVIGGGCSWYCGGAPQEVTASSALKPQGTNSYGADNAQDLSFKTAWVEGVPGYGVGEYLLYKFSSTSPRITDIIVINGYVKSERAYRDNSRVKKLKMYLNDTPYAILLLDDQRSRQRFKFAPIGHGNREDGKALKLLPSWTLKFEILEVYKGLKYDDVAITEIYFDGIDVH